MNPTQNLLRALMRRLNHSSLMSDYVYEQLEKYPQKNSLASYHYILSWMGIENMGVQVSSETLAAEIPLPTIVHLDRSGAPFAIVDRIDSESVTISAGKRIEKIPRQRFDEIFSGNCIAFAADSPDIDKKDYIRWLIVKASKYVLPVIVSIAFIMCLVVPKPVNIFGIIYAVLFLAGLAASIMLFSKQEGVQIKLADTICKSGGESSNCNSVMDSKGGKLFGIISWSDIGVIYFATALISLLILGYDKLGLIVSVLSVICISYVFYSIWYQWRVVRKWCPLCLSVQAVFILQLIVAIFAFNHAGMQFHLYPLIVFGVIGIIIAALVFVLEPLINRAVRFPYTERNFREFRHEPEVMDLLMNGKSYDTSGVSQMIINPEAENIVTFVFSTFCGPCLVKIKGILKLLTKYDVGLRVVMPLKNPEDAKELSLIEYFITRCLESPEKFIQLMDSYPDDYSTIRQKFGTFKSSNPEIVHGIILSHYQWFYANGFTGTPVILYNNHKLPDYYNLHDLEIIIIEGQ